MPRRGPLLNGEDAAALREALQGLPCSDSDLAEWAGVHRGTMSRFLRPKPGKVPTMSAPNARQLVKRLISEGLIEDDPLPPQEQSVEVGGEVDDERTLDKVTRYANLEEALEWAQTNNYWTEGEITQMRTVARKLKRDLSVTEWLTLGDSFFRVRQDGAVMGPEHDEKTEL